MTSIDHQKLQAWLANLDELPLECDGLTRVVSALLEREGIAHQVRIGRLEVVGVGVIPLHWWVVLAEGAHIDFRVRMWLGHSDLVPHGVFNPSDKTEYAAQAAMPPAEAALPLGILSLMAGTDLSTYPEF